MHASGQPLKVKFKVAATQPGATSASEGKAHKANAVEDREESVVSCRDHGFNPKNTFDKRVESVLWIEPVIAATDDGFLPIFDCVRFVGFAFTGGGRTGLSGGDFEFNLEWLAGRMHQHVLNQAQVV